MASLFTIDSEKQVLYALDAGAGSGYKKSYAENSRETFRKQAIHHFRNASFIEDNGKSTNSPDYRYRLTEEFLAVIRGNGTAEVVSHFLSNHESLISIYASKKKFQKIPVTINGKGCPEDCAPDREGSRRVASSYRRAPRGCHRQGYHSRRLYHQGLEHHGAEWLHQCHHQGIDSQEVARLIIDIVGSTAKESVITIVLTILECG